MVEKLEVLMILGNRVNFRYVIRISEKTEENRNNTIFRKRTGFLGRYID